MYSPRGVPWQRRGVAPDFFIEQDEKTVDALLKLPAKERVTKDTAMAAAFKLLQGKPQPKPAPEPAPAKP